MATFTNNNAAHVYTQVRAELAKNFFVTGATKHDPAKRLLETPDSLRNWLAKLDRCPKKLHRTDDGGGPREIVFNLQACQRIMRDPTCTDVGDLRERIATAIVHHRTNAMGIEESTTEAAGPPSLSSNEEDGAVSSDNTVPDVDAGRATRRGRSRSRSVTLLDSHNNVANEAHVDASPHAHEQLHRGQASIDAVMNSAMQALLSPDLRATYDVAMAVLAHGIDGKSDAEKRVMWSSLCPFGHRHGPAMRNLVRAAAGVILGDAWTPEATIGLDTTLLTATVERVLPADDPDRARACLALRIIRRSTLLLPGATLETVLDCNADEVRGKMRDAHHLLFSWEMRWVDDERRRVPEPWIVDVCKTALRVLDDLM